MLEKVIKQAGVKTRMISAENPTGEKGGACRAVPDPSDPALFHSSKSLGKGWKVNPFIRIAPHTNATLAISRGLRASNRTS